MKKKSKFISIVIVIIIIGFIYFKYIFGWLEFRNNNYTPKEYKSLVQVSKEQYFTDSLSLVAVIRGKIKTHQHPYYNLIRVNEKYIYINDSLTKIYIDSIFYSPDLSKLVFLVIVENENKKLYNGMTKSETKEWEKTINMPFENSHFDGESFIIKRDKYNKFGITSSFSKNSFINSPSYREISTDLKNDCMNHPVSKKDELATYNVDDKRFWDSAIWNFDK